MLAFKSTKCKIFRPWKPHNTKYFWASKVLEITDPTLQFTHVKVAWRSDPPRPSPLKKLKIQGRAHSHQVLVCPNIPYTIFNDGKYLNLIICNIYEVGKKTFIFFLEDLEGEVMAFCWILFRWHLPEEMNYTISWFLDAPLSNWTTIKSIKLQPQIKLMVKI